MNRKVNFLVFYITLGTIFFCTKLCFTQEEKVERLEDYSKYGYTLKYKDPEVYTTEPGEKKSPYHQAQPQLPPALEGRTKPQWSKPSKLERVKPEELYMPPQDFFAFTGVLPKQEAEEEKIFSAEGEFSLEEFVEKIKIFVEEITGKEIEVVLVEESSALATPVAPVEETEEENSEEIPSQKLFFEGWEIFLKGGRLTLKPLGKVPQEDLEKIAAYLVDLLGRGGEITEISPEGIEVKIK